MEHLVSMWKGLWVNQIKEINQTKEQSASIAQPVSLLDSAGFLGPCGQHITADVCPTSLGRYYRSAGTFPSGKNDPARPTANSGPHISAIESQQSLFYDAQCANLAKSYNQYNL